MIARRTTLFGLAATMASPPFAIVRAGEAPKISFEDLLAKARNAPDELETARGDREGLLEFYEQQVTRAIAPRRPPSKRAISDDAAQMVITFEVTDRKRYEVKYQHPIWPKGQSGVTIAIGYDVGYVTPAWLREDWAGILSAEDLTRLEGASGVTGPAAKALLPQLASLRIGWDAAYKQFTTTGLPRYVAETLAVLPNAASLSNDSLGALVSLVYNRGPSFKKTTDRYREMRAIKLHMVRKEFSKIPAELLSMRRLWEGDPDLKGLLLRREMEAALFDRGLG